ncbi:MAG: hypothetical protein CME06_16250 [Gemmatimonadetes bacterium]|nr:hypothetical protein [Gemmatimonadota bacterium]
MLEHCSFVENFAKEDGGAGEFLQSDVHIEDCTFVRNRIGFPGGLDGTADGGAIYSVDTNLFIERCIFADHETKTDWYLPYFSFGGGICAWDGYLEVMDSRFVNGLATHGGAIWASGAAGSINRTVFAQNRAIGTANEYHLIFPGEGGAVSWVSSSGNVNVTNSTFVDNLAHYHIDSRAGDGAAILIGAEGFCGNNSIVENVGGPAVAIASRTVRWGYQLFHGNADGEYSRYGFIQPVDVMGVPEFVDPEERDYRITSGSKALDVGHPDVVDLDGTRSDIGAHAIDQRYPVHAYISRSDSVLELGETEEWSVTVDNILPESVVEEIRICLEKDGRQIRTVRRSLRLGPGQVWRGIVRFLVPAELGQGTLTVSVLLGSGWEEEWRGHLVAATGGPGSESSKTEVQGYPLSPIRCVRPADAEQVSPM